MRVGSHDTHNHVHLQRSAHYRIVSKFQPGRNVLPRHQLLVQIILQIPVRRGPRPAQVPTSGRILTVGGEPATPTNFVPRSVLLLREHEQSGAGRPLAGRGRHGFRPGPGRHFHDQSAVLRRANQGQAGREHPRDVGDEQNRGRMDVRGAQGRHEEDTSLHRSVREIAGGGETLRHSTGRPDSQDYSGVGLLHHHRQTAVEDKNFEASERALPAEQRLQARPPRSHRDHPHAQDGGAGRPTRGEHPQFVGEGKDQPGLDVRPERGLGDEKEPAFGPLSEGGRGDQESQS